MQHRLVLGFAAIAALGGGCATGVTFLGSGTGATGTGGLASDGGAGGSGGAGGAGAADAGSDALPDGPIACVHASDCAALTDACNTGACFDNVCERMPANESGPCDDGLYCTDGDTCAMGVCTGTPKTCPGVDACHVGACDEASKSCQAMAGNDGAPCTPTNTVCFSSGFCSSGACIGDTPTDCSFLTDDCNQGTCDPMFGCKQTPDPDGTSCFNGPPPTPCSATQCMAGLCTAAAVNEGGPCDDGLFCTIDDHCSAGTCIGGGPNPCTQATTCFVGSCDEVNQKCTSIPGNDGAACMDGDVCNTGKQCKAGACAGGTPANDGMMCSSGSSCVVGTTCTNGVCGGGMGPTVYFSESFDDNSKGWALDSEWQIGPAMTSSCQNYQGPDPAIDHTMNAAKGVAGIVIGGCETPSVHPFYYLTSPPFDTSQATGTVIFGYHRWLNSDYDPFMHDTVDVFDGTTWVNLWTTSGPPGVNDTSWTYVSFDVTAHKNAKMQVRFGYNITSAGVFTVSSWNVDDVLIASAACP